MIFILDKKERVINVLKNNKVATSKKSYFDDLLYEDLDTGASTFSVSTNAYNETSQDLIVGNYVAFKDKKGNYRLFQITNVETEHNESMTITIYSECAGLSLINNVFRKRKMTSVTIRKFIDAITENTDWSTGFIEEAINTSLDLDIPDGSCYSTLQTYIKKFGVEVEFRVELNNGRVSKKYIDTYRQRGRATGKRFTYGRDIEKIVKTSDSSELYTALIGRGKNDITFRDVTVEGIDKPLGQDFVADKSSFERFNRNGYHLTGIYSVDSDSPEVVLRETYKKLQEVKEPKISYEIPVILLGELLGIEYDKVSIGDQIGILDTDFNPPLMLSARVSKLYVSETNNENTKCVLSNFKEASSNITEEMRKIASELEGYVDKKFPIGSSDIQEEAVNGSHMDKQYVTQITADIVKASLIEADKIIATEIEAVNGKFETVNAEIVKANEVIADLGKFDTVIAGKVDAVEGNFVELESEVGRINTLVSGNITSDNIHSSGISSDKLTIRDGFIKNAMIDTVNASKITAGEINTNNVHITSENGGIVIADNTQQFKDKSGKVRIQIGQDAQGNFNFGVFDATGTGVLIDADGIKEKAIADGLIKDKMIGTGEIGGNKINISSMIDEVNKDGNIKTIKGSKVQLDTEGQTLDIAFNTLKTNVNNIQVGGRNFVKNSNFAKDAESWILSSAGSSSIDKIVKYEDSNTIHINVADKSSDVWSGAVQKEVIKHPVIGEYYTVSFMYLVKDKSKLDKGFTVEAKGRNSTNTVAIGGYKIIQASDVVDNQWTRYTFTFKLTNKEVTSIDIFPWVRRNGEVWITNIKLERGNKPTDWTPAPEDVDTKIEANTTEIQVQQGKIATLISDTTIEKNGENLKLKDEYSKLEQTVSGINSTVGSHTTNISNLQGQINTANGNISNLNGKVQTVESKQVSFEQNLSGISQKVSSTESNITTLKGQVATANNNITSTNNKLDGLKIGTDNLVENSAFNQHVNGKPNKWSILGSGNIVWNCNNTSTHLGGHRYLIFTNNDTVERFLKSTRFGLKPNTEYTCSFYAHTDAGAVMDVFVLYSNTITDISDASTAYDVTPNKSGITTNSSWIKYEFKFTTNNTAKTGYVRIDNNTGGGKSVRIGLIKLEEGNKATAWCKSSKDIESDINSVDSKVTTTNNKVAELTTNLNGITQRVGTTESKTSILEKTTEKMLINNFSRSGIKDRWSSNIGTITASNAVGYYANVSTNGNAQVTSEKFEIDASKSYKISLMVQNPSENGTGSWFFGVYAYDKDNNNIGVYLGTGTSLDTNAYFHHEQKANKNTTWRTFEAYIYSHNTVVNANTPKGNCLAFMKFHPKTKYLVMRFLNYRSEPYGNGQTGSIYFAHPTISVIDNRIVDTETRLKTAESKITSNAIINTVSSTINSAKNEAINSANSSTDSKLQNYATKSSLTQTAENITAKFTSGGGCNLLENSDAKNGQYMWTGNGVTPTIGTSGATPFFGGNEFRSTFPKGLKYSKSIKLKANTDYVYEGWIYCGVSFKGSGVTPLHYWCMNTPNTSGQAQLEVLDYRQDITKNVFNKCYVHFRTKSGDVYFTPFVYGGPEGQMVAVRQLSLTEGKVETAWTPHPSEIYEGSTVIDASGVTVNNGALRVKNRAGQTVLSGDSEGNLSLTGSIAVSSHNHQMLRVDTADTKFPHMVVDTYGPYMDRLSVCNDYAGYVAQKAVDGVFIRNNRMEIYGTGETFWMQGNMKVANMVTCNGSFQGKDFSLGETSGNRVLDSPWYGLGRSTNTSGGGRMVQLSGYYGLLLKTAGNTISIPHAGNISITGSDIITIKNNNNWKSLDLYRYGCGARFGIGSDGTGGSQNFPAIECWNSGASSYSSRLEVKSDQLQYYNASGGTFKCWTNTGGHGGITIGNTGSGYLKWLRGHSDIQCRNYDDNAYTRINASVFVVNSKKSVKENIEDFKDDEAINILMSNKVRHYNLINERKELEAVEREAEVKGFLLDEEMVIPDNHLGLVIEELTPEALDVLQPGRTEGIDIYAMTSLLWKVCQAQENKIKSLEKENNELKDRLKIIEEKLGI